MSGPADYQRIGAVAGKHHATLPQVMLAALLQRSPVMIPIPGTGSLAHLLENALLPE